MTPGILLQFAVHGRDQPLLVWWKTGRHFSLGKRSTKYSVLKKPVVSVPSSGRPTLVDHLRDFGKGAENLASPLRDARALGGSGAGRQGAAHPDRAFVKMRQELRSDHAAEGQVDRAERMRTAPLRPSATDCEPPTQHPCGSASVRNFITGFPTALTPGAKQETCQRGRDKHREDQCAKQGESHRPCHRLKQLSLRPVAE
jgi:hypothetical protein